MVRTRLFFIYEWQCDRISKYSRFARIKIAKGQNVEIPDLLLTKVGCSAN
ncbi:hypothetical protein [Nostoc sp. DedQUE04]|nr:hypothetical protein [Nostoc sp. DedQUE04]